MIRNNPHLTFGLHIYFIFVNTYCLKFFYPSSNPNVQVHIQPQARSRRPLILGSQSTAIELSSRFGYPEDNSESVLPSECGSTIDNRIIGGDLTELTEFPWMAVLIYNMRL